jgi:opacity protein-like surface antigen
MTFRVAAAVFALAAAPAARGGDWELAVSVGPTFPFYEQSFEFDPGAIPGPGGVVIEDAGVFRLDGRGGLALGAALAFHPHRVFGIEARVDTADVDVRTEGARYDVRATLPPPIGTISTTVAFTEGEGDLERLRPVSLNLRLRSPGELAVFASGGISYLPGFRFVIRQPVEASIGDGPLFPVGEVSLPAEALPEEEGDGRWGWNAGGGLQWHVGPRVRVLLDGRYFYFQRQTLFWGDPEGAGALDIVQRDLVREITARLEPARFNPTFFQATAGVAVSF